MLPSLLLAAAAVFATTGQARPALDAAFHDLCRSETALLGEAADHGDARTIEAKTILVRRLVDECGFGAILFEAGSYDFLELERRRRGEQVERGHVASAIGGVWNRYREMQPLIDFLYARASSGRLHLGGIDDQLGSAGAFYSIDAMPAEFSGRLPAPEAASCRVTMRWLIYGQVDAGERHQVTACLDAFRAAVSRQGPGVEQRERLHMLDNMDRFARANWPGAVGSGPRTRPVDVVEPRLAAGGATAKNEADRLGRDRSLVAGCARLAELSAGRAIRQLSGARSPRLLPRL